MKNLSLSKLLSFIGLLLLVQACKSSESGIIAYDPPGRTTETKPLDPHHLRTIGIAETGVWASNEFVASRMNDFYRVEDNLYRVTIAPENAPINWSSWYSFKLWSDTPQTIRLELAYENGYHRYIPKLSTDRIHWTALDTTEFVHDREAGTALLTLDVTPEPIYVSAQEHITSEDVYAWADSLTTLPFVEQSVIGQSHRGRDLVKLVVNATGNPDAPVIVVMGRQHPPEIPGAMAMETFVNTFTSDEPEAMAFRSRYQMIVYPLINPDGVDGGHWRHNFGGVDLNRDWKAFNQPETRAVADDLIGYQERGVFMLYSLDFHSTIYDVYYTSNKDIPTNLPGLTDRWLAGINAILPDYEIREEPSGVVSPVSKNFMYHTFFNNGVTYEVGDATPRPLIRDVARAAAISMIREVMKLDAPELMSNPDWYNADWSSRQ
ncbi:MAG: putative carboxypeptidase [Bacteroidetes bacterium HLUCCA01]|nr:MAG: putative carboxypeptidase [Bacteroidetes bacterium HLUCCA01]